jgi:perosamine synthetase
VSRLTRRTFLGAVAAGGVAFAGRSGGASSRQPAILGGVPVRREPFSGWPVADVREEQALQEVLRSGRWWRGSGKQVERFEAEYAKLTGATHCLATANGTSALLISLHALGVGAGDEVIVPPYTFVATVNVVLLLHALPVFVDTDIETCQIDARKIEQAITDRTRVIMPVHLGGSAADMDTILRVARQRGVPVVEDACQAHLAEWRGRKVGTWGTTGCFSFQASKHLNAGEGGAILADDEALVERCYAFHNNSRGRTRTGDDFTYGAPGANLRLTEFQAAVLLAQMTRLEAQARTRDENAAYLTSLLAEIPGINPVRMYDGCTRNAWHIYMMRYDQEQFGGPPRRGFLKALRAEGIPASAGYAPLNKEPFLERALSSRGYQAIYSRQQLDELRDRNRCPQNDRLCREAVWFGQTMLLGARGDMDQIADAIRKIRAHAGRLPTA